MTAAIEVHYKAYSTAHIVLQGAMERLIGFTEVLITKISHGLGHNRMGGCLSDDPHISFRSDSVMSVELLNYIYRETIVELKFLIVFD